MLHTPNIQFTSTCLGRDNLQRTLPPLFDSREFFWWLIISPKDYLF